MDEYLIVNGKRISKSEFYRTLTINQIREFAYDPQLSLFPILKVEEVRKNLRKKLENGETPQIKIISSLF